MEELKMMINIMKPEYFIPVQGEFKIQIAHAKLAAEAGVAHGKDLPLWKKEMSLITTVKI